MRGFEVIINPGLPTQAEIETEAPHEDDQRPPVKACAVCDAWRRHCNRLGRDPGPDPAHIAQVLCAGGAWLLKCGREWWV